MLMLKKRRIEEKKTRIINFKYNNNNSIGMIIMLRNYNRSTIFKFSYKLE